jgi:hypothetical protein
VPEHTSAQHRQHAQQLWAAWPKWEFDDISATLGNRCAPRKILYKLFFGFIAIDFCIQLMLSSDRRTNATNCNDLGLILRGFGQLIQFVLLRFG